MPFIYSQMVIILHISMEYREFFFIIYFQFKYNLRWFQANVWQKIISLPVYKYTLYCRYGIFTPHSPTRQSPTSSITTSTRMQGDSLVSEEEQESSQNY